MAGLCYNYAKQLGRDAFVWGGFSFFFPFLTPLLLGFLLSEAQLHCRCHSTHARQTQVKGRPVSGTFQGTVSPAGTELRRED